MAPPLLTLVLLPGMDGTGELFAPFIAALGNTHCRTVVVRYPGDEPLGYTRLEALARAALPAQGPFVVLGESFSGPIAVALAAANTTPRFKGLILCASFARSPHPLLAGLRPLVGWLPVKLAPVGISSQPLLGRWSTAALRSAVARALAQVSAATLHARIRAVMAVDVRERLRRVDVPVLYLRATHDRVVPAAASRLIAQLQPATRIVDVDGPHFLLQTKPEECAKVVLAFLDEVKAAR